MYFDTHAHYDDGQFDGDRDLLLASLPERGVSLIVNAASGLSSAAASIALAEKYSFVYAAVGIHPEEAESFSPAALDELRRLAAHEKAVAIGEIGLDYYYDGPPRELQRAALRGQLALAQELGLPVVIHDREAHADCMELVREFPGLRGVFHCYSGGVEMARELLDLGWYISFTGAVTFKNARRAPEVAAFVPEDRYMIETDSPYLAPVPVRGKRNDSSNLRHIAARIAEIRGTAAERVAECTMENGKRFFGIR